MSLSYTDTLLQNYFMICAFLGMTVLNAILLMVFISVLHDTWKWIKKSFKKMVRKLYYALYE